LKSLGLASAIGIILGIVMTWWVKPDTNAGAVFIVVTMVLICVVIGAIVNFLFNFRKSPDHEAPPENN
jgi:heme/copper-type cytochrome/quinol oxidase subunit 2